jgi:hypothetical protein
MASPLRDRLFSSAIDKGELWELTRAPEPAVHFPPVSPGGNLKYINGRLCDDTMSYA